MKNTTAIILASVVAAAGLHALVRIKDEGVSPELFRILLGAFLLGAFLLLLAEFWADGARGLALVILVTAVVMNGGKFAQLVAQLVD